MPKSAKNLTKGELDSLRRRAKEDPEFKTTRADGGQKGLYVRVRDGRVEFWFRVRRPGGRRRMKRIGNFGDLTLRQARETAQEWLGIKAKKKDVIRELEERDRAARTVGDVIDAYLTAFKRRYESGAKRGRRSTYAEFERMLKRRELEDIRSLPVGDITRDHLAAAQSKLKPTPAAANRTVTALSAALAHGGITCGKVSPLQESGGRRKLEDDELRRLGEALTEAEGKGAVTVDGRQHAIHPSVVLAVRFLALTGFRRGELLGSPHTERRGSVDGLTWGDVDLKTGLVTLKDSKTGPQVRVLGRVASDLLSEAKPNGASGDHCVCPGTGNPRRPFRSINAARRQLWRAAELPLERGCDLHSLRHSFASKAAHLADGRYAGLVSALLGHGHQSKAITRRYVSDDPELLRPAADVVAAEIARLLGLGKGAEILEFPTEGSGPSRRA